MNVRQFGEQARAAAGALALASASQRNAFLLALAHNLEGQVDGILAANALDVQDAMHAGHTPALVDRLTLNPARLGGMAQDLRHVAALPDPLSARFSERTLENGLQVYRQRVPVGVLGVIYEARPNVTTDIAGLAVKTGNAALLRGSSETLRSNLAILAVIQASLREAGLPADAVQLLADPARELVLEMLQQQDTIDLIIPRGGARLHAFCREHSRIPVITGGIGICHLFLERSGNLESAIPVLYNAKVQRPTVCNALDTVLVDQAIAEQAILPVIQALAPAGVTFRLDPGAWRCIEPALQNGTLDPAIVQPAGPDDFDTEWLALILSIRVVSGLDEAIQHIRDHSTGHSDGILTQDERLAGEFVRRVDSAAVYVNASTRFTDGAQLGLGAEVAISTQKIHARGPMGLEELTSYKWVIRGQYHTRPG